jgi:hypothetical protein
MLLFERLPGRRADPSSSEAARRRRRATRAPPSHTRAQRRDEQPRLRCPGSLQRATPEAYRPEVHRPSERRRRRSLPRPDYPRAYQRRRPLRGQVPSRSWRGAR